MNGQVIEYDDEKGTVQDSDGSDATHPFRRENCSQRLAAALGSTPIPIDVTYDVAGTGWAIDVDLAQPISLAASEESEPVRSSAAQTAAKKPAPKKKAVKAPAKTAKKKSASKKVAAKKSRKQPRKSAPKRRRP